MVTRQRSRADQKPLKMKDLERATGIGRESIRFYIREGLLPEPERPGRNVAYYDESFVERIRFIKELQQKRYLPLQVIKAIVASEVEPAAAEVDALLALDGKLFPYVEASREKASERLSALAARTGIPVREMREFAAIGAIEIVTRDGGQWVEGASVRMVELWGRLRQAGFSAKLGIGPAQCRLYVDMVRWLAREELRMLTRNVAGKVPVEQAARMIEQGIDIVNQILGLLRKQTLLRYIAQGNIPNGAGRRRPQRPAKRTS